MRLVHTLSLISLAAATGLPAMTPKMKMASATLMDATGASKGSAQVVQNGSDLKLMVKVSGLTPGVHGVHLHMTGTCTAPDFTSAGGHWNPTAKHHGMNNPEGMHMGDLPNVTAGQDGSGTLTATIAGAALEGGATPLLDEDGAAVVIHAGPDDYMSDPAGNSGARIACGVLKLS